MIWTRRRRLLLPDAKALQTHPARFCECQEGFEKSRNPRNEGCVRCGRLPQDLKPLAAYTEEMFENLAQILEASGDKPKDQASPTFDYLKFRTMQRVQWGQKRHGENWRGIDRPENAKQEGFDWWVYLAGELGLEAPDDPDLYDALHKMYQGLEAVLRYQARKKGTP